MHKHQINNPQPCHALPVVLAILVLAWATLLPSADAQAAWHSQAGNLPGMVDLTPVLVAGAVVLGVVIVAAAVSHNAKKTATAPTDSEQGEKDKKEAKEGKEGKEQTGSIGDMEKARMGELPGLSGRASGRASTAEAAGDVANGPRLALLIAPEGKPAASGGLPQHLRFGVGVQIGF